ncbi:MAG: hypothetical protein J5769_05275 [Bacteroidales bacterium]|nr:hypothetical protein [Bacteroidales bacterium]
MLQRNTIEITELELLSFLAKPAGDGQNFFAPPCGVEKVLVHDGKTEPVRTASSRINVADTSHLGLPEATIRIACSKGTYIRAFARDLGEALSSGAHLSALQRSRSGSYRIDDCLSLDEALSALQA